MDLVLIDLLESSKAIGLCPMGSLILIRFFHYCEKSSKIKSSSRTVHEI